MANVFNSIINFLFGCWHQNTSRAFTVSGETYVVCLDCGRELPYSLEKMAIQSTSGFEPKTAHAALEPAMQPVRHYSSRSINSPRAA